MKDGYDTSRLLLVDTLLELSRHVDGDLVIAIPSQHVHYAFDGGNADVVELMRRVTSFDHQRFPDPLTTSWLTVSGNEVLLYESQTEHRN